MIDRTESPMPPLDLAGRPKQPQSITLSGPSKIEVESVEIVGEETLAEHLRNVLVLLNEAARLRDDRPLGALDMLLAIHPRITRALEQAEAANFHALEITEFIDPRATFGDLIVAARADLDLITEAGKDYADAVARQRALDVRKYIERDRAARRLVDAGTMIGAKLSYTAAEKIAVVDPDYAAHELDASAAEHATTLAHAEFLAAPLRAKLSILLAEAHLSKGV